MEKETLKQKLLRMPESLIWKVKSAAAQNRRTENQEMIKRIEDSFNEKWINQ
ncbi:MAG TPA: Arc family DNA-binding protein [Arsenophonus apicola]|uniref:Arc family DNA-binding protein n=1 Tax=Arsenophonus endosymbiont of Apis mellifera TaxID=1541805 RepID=UPI0015D916BD|nr:Arc family DNA-binding protein [Arsenophonus endosymbiont of Apis mellifera]